MDELQKKFIEINHINIDELIVFIRYKVDEGEQFWIKFKPSYENYTLFTIIEFSHYKKTKEHSEKISLFGNNNNKILYQTIKSFLNNLVPIGNTNTFTIGIGDIIPEDNECIDYIIDKSDIEYCCNKTCPICDCNYDNYESIRLNCNHKVCRNCFFEMLNHDPLQCPVCRHPICGSPSTHNSYI